MVKNIVQPKRHAYVNLFTVYRENGLGISIYIVRNYLIVCIIVLIFFEVWTTGKTIISTAEVISISEVSKYPLTETPARSCKYICSF